MILFKSPSLPRERGRVHVGRVQQKLLYNIETLPDPLFLPVRMSATTLLKDAQVRREGQEPDGGK